jgi:hypothetical protein
MEEPAEYLWETDTTPFSFNSSSVFQKKYGFLDETNDNVEDYQEGFVNQIKSFFEKTGNDIKDGTTGVFDKLREIGDQINQGFQFLQKIGSWVDDKIIKPTRSFFQNMYDELRYLQVRFTRLGWGLRDLFIAIGNSFVTVWNTIGIELRDVGNLIVGGGKCSVHFINNFRSCLIYYLFDAIVSLIYHLFMLIPWMIDSVGNTNVVSQIKKVYTYIDKADKTVHKIVGVSFLHYPKSVIETCYKCKDVDFSRLVKQLYDDNADINRSFVDLGNQYDHAGKVLNSVFGKME